MRRYRNWTAKQFAAALVAAFRNLPELVVESPTLGRTKLAAATCPAAVARVKLDPTLLFTVTADALGYSSGERAFILEWARRSALGDRGDVEDLWRSWGLKDYAAARRRRNAICRKCAKHLNSRPADAETEPLQLAA